MGKYVRHELLGKGGFASVFRATDAKGKEWALKKLFSDDANEVARFRREVRIQQDLKHENIVTVVAANISQPDPFYVMEKADHNLEKLIPKIAKDHSRMQPISRSFPERS